MSRAKDWAITLFKKTEDGKVKSIGFFDSGTMYLTGDYANGYYFLVDNERVVYFVKYKRINAGGVQFGRQVLVWRDNESSASAAFASFVFFQVLLPRFKALMSDTQQTPDGSRFWSTMIGFAHRKGLHVYAYDRSRPPTALYTIKNSRDLDLYRGLIWGRTDKHLRTHVVISLKPLTLEHNKFL